MKTTTRNFIFVTAVALVIFTLSRITLNITFADVTRTVPKSTGAQITRGQSITVDWHLSGTKLAVGSTDGDIWIYDIIGGTTLADGQRLASPISGERRVTNVLWSPDGSYLLAEWIDMENPYQNGTRLELWNMNTYLIDVTIPISFHESRVYSQKAVWNPLNIFQIASVGNQDNEIVIWNARTGQAMDSWQTIALVTSIAWSPDGTKIAANEIDGNIRIWDVNTHTLIGTLENSGSFDSLAWNPDSSKIVGYRDHDVVIWETTTSQPIATLQRHNDNIFDVTWIGNYIASIGFSGIFIWDVSNLSNIALVGELEEPEGTIVDIDLHPSASSLAVASEQGLRILAIEPITILSTIPEYTPSVRSFSWNHDGTEIATVSEVDTLLRVWNVSNGQLVSSISGHTSFLRDVAWSANGTKIATNEENIVKIWDASNGRSLQTSTNFSYGGRIEWSPNNTALAGAYANQTVILDTTTGNLLQTIEGYAVHWNPDGTRLAGVKDNYVTIWDVNTGQIVKVLPTTHGIIDWSTDGTRLVSGGADGTLQVWEVSTGTLLLEIDRWAGTGSVNSLSWNPTSNTVASAIGGDIWFWDVATGHTLKLIESGEFEITKIEWSPDGTRLARVGSNGTIRIWTVDECFVPNPDNNTAPVLVSPCGTNNIEGYPTYIWWGVPGADYYQILSGNGSIQAFGPNGRWYAAAEVCQDDLCQVRWSDYPTAAYFHNGSYTWYVRSYNSATRVVSAGGTGMAFSITAPQTPILDLANDANASVSPMIAMDSTATNQHITLKWSPHPQVDFYQVYVVVAGVPLRGDQVFKDTWYPEEVVCTATLCQVTLTDAIIPALSAATTGQWYIRAYNPSAYWTGDFGWSVPRSFPVQVFSPVQQMLGESSAPFEPLEISNEAEILPPNGGICQDNPMCLMGPLDEMKPE